jgi:hypothetical protein
MTQMYEVVVKAAGEVRDKDGNFISSSEGVFERKTVSADQLSTIPDDELRAAGMTDQQINDIKGNDQ